ncbi:MAG: ribosome maturation factor RimP [Ruminococcaceae bacterium]|jgi:ribosome maturation factor RimP|nr:ribosome maturation factor RimP [Oscillospiraceae bacterium]
MSVTKDVAALAQPVIEGLNMDLIDTEYIKEGSKWVLRLYIDKDGGVGLDDCQLVSEALNDLLDGADIIKTPYTFEVSSPGLDRPLKTDKDFQRYKGDMVEVHLYAPINGSKLYTGTLHDRKDGMITIVCEEKEITFAEKDIAKINRAIIWN